MRAAPRMIFNCLQCVAENIVTDFDLPGYDFSAEVHSEGSDTVEVTVECEECGRVHEIAITNMLGYYSAEMVGPDKTNISIDVPEEFDDWDEYVQFLKTYVPSNPQERYSHSLELVDEMMKEAGKLTSYPLFARMLLLHHVGVMEAYLGDRMILMARAFPSVRESFAQNIPKFREWHGKQKAPDGGPLSLAEAVPEYLKYQLYHSMDNVEKYFKAALGVSPFTDDAHKAFMVEVIKNRHHCTHRDGKDIEGNVLRSIDLAYVEQVKDKIYDLIWHIDDRYSTLRASVSKF